MTPYRLLKKLPKFMSAGASQARGGLLFIHFDRRDVLRDQLGFTGLEKLQAAAIKRISRRLADLPGESGEICRFAWGQLVAICPDIEPERVDSLAQAVFDDIRREAFEVGGDRVALTTSLAFAHFDHRFTGPDEMLLPLVRKVEAIEAEGGNLVAEVAPGISAQQARNSDDHMLGLLMEALNKDAMKVVFQPLLSTSNHEETENYQMLPRLTSGDGKLIPAAEFLPQAREAALLPVLDRWMTVYALRLLRGPLKGRDVRLFVNQSEALLSDASRREWLSERLSAEPELAGHLVLELPLEDAMTHLDGASALLDLAGRCGAAVCLSHVDEHSRWDLLAGDLRVSFVRMSPAFVARLTEEPALEEAFMKVSSEVRALGTRVIMPMIEDPRTAASMWRSGADYMQGNMIQAPEDSIAV